MPQTRVLRRTSGLALLGSQVHKESSLWQNRAYRAPGISFVCSSPRLSFLPTNRALHSHAARERHNSVLRVAQTGPALFCFRAATQHFVFTNAGCSGPSSIA